LWLRPVIQPPRVKATSRSIRAFRPASRKSMPEGMKTSSRCTGPSTDQKAREPARKCDRSETSLARGEVVKKFHGTASPFIVQERHYSEVQQLGVNGNDARAGFGFEGLVSRS